jgi:hypothetical protein
MLRGDFTCCVGGARERRFLGFALSDGRIAMAMGVLSLRSIDWLPRSAR